MLVQNRLKTKAVFLFATLSLAACGQNASIAKKGALHSASSLTRTTTPPANQTGPSGLTGSTGSTGSTGPTGLAASIFVTPGTPKTPTASSPASPTPPSATSPVAGPAGHAGPASSPAGATGPAGRDGCGIMDMAPVNVVAVPMEDGDYRAADLPYQSSRAHHIGTLQIGQASPNKATPSGVPYVQDSQVLFKFPMHLPPKESITHLYNAYIQLSLTKLSNDGFPDTEWLCFIDQKICSGKIYQPNETTWQANINWSFWSNLKGDVGDAFVTQLRGDQVARFQGMTLWASDAFTLKIEDLIKSSSYSDVLSFIYDGVDANAPLEREIHAVVADDTRVSSAKLVLEYQEDTCKALELQGAPAPAHTGTLSPNGAALK